MPGGTAEITETEVLERIATGAPLHGVLELIVQMIEARAEGMLCSILLLDEPRKRLLHGAAPSLPSEYARALDGAEIGPTAGSCGAAAFRRERVIVSDIATHPNWVDYRALALPHGLAACWSTPIFSPEREVLGTFAMYYRTPREPVEAEIGWVGAATHLAAVAIVRDRAERSLRQSEARARQLTRLYAVSSAITEALVRVREPQTLYETACRIAVEHGLAALACVGAYDAANDHVMPLARFGAGHGDVDAIDRLAAPPIARGLAAKALQSGMVALSNDVESDPGSQHEHEALERGLRSCAVFPLRLGGGAPGVFVLHGAHADFFLAEETRVLTALCHTISFALESAHVEARLRQSARLLDVASRAARLGGWFVDLRSGAMQWSERACALVGMPPGTIPTADEVLARYAPEHHEALKQAYSACMHEGTPYDLEVEVLTSEGKRRWVRTIGYAERDSSGAIVALEGALQDIDERRKLEEQLRRAQKMEAIGQLAGGVAHDFNNLLTVILSYAALAATGLDPRDRRSADIEEIRLAGTRAAELTKQLLAFGRQQVSRPRALDVGEVLVAMHGMLQRLLGESVELSVSLHGSGARALADPTQLEQIVLNLAVNARDAMPHGGKLTIETEDVTIDEASGLERGVPAGRYVMLAMTDTGVGMDRATRERIFEPFFTTKEKGKGTGLGLATVFGIIEQSGGRIVVSSEPGRGARFEVYLPRTDAGVETDASRPRERSAPGGSECILLVEDDAQVREISRAILLRHGYRVIDAANAGEAVLAFEQEGSSIDLLVTDVVMPRMSGPVLARRLRLTRPDLRVLYVSGWAEGALGPEAVDPDAPLLGKPFAPDVLLAKVRSVLDRHAG